MKISNLIYTYIYICGKILKKSVLNIKFSLKTLNEREEIWLESDANGFSVTIEGRHTETILTEN